MRFPAISASLYSCSFSKFAEFDNFTVQERLARKLAITSTAKVDRRGRVGRVRDPCTRQQRNENGGVFPNLVPGLFVWGSKDPIRSWSRDA